MRASFLHLADTHLGYEQYGVKERFNDFSRAFWSILDVALERDVDFVVIAGDLFNKRAIDALTLIHAIEGLKKLKAKNIPVLTIEGNHDRSYYREGASWLQFLCHQGYIMLLNPVMEDGAPILEPWDPATMQGAYVDLCGGRLRVYGLPWQGSATARTMEGFAKMLEANEVRERSEGIEYRLLMMHTGVEEMIGRMQGLPARGAFQPLRQRINYLALGHVHKPYEMEGWIYNPGSTETCSAEEISWPERGYYLVEINTDEPFEEREDGSNQVHKAVRHPGKRRSFVRHEIRVEGIEDPDLLYQKLTDFCREESERWRRRYPDESKPVILINLVGTLPFDRGVLDQARMEKTVSHYFDPLYVRIDNNTSDQDYDPEDGGLDGRDRASWQDLEKKIFQDLVGRDARYLVRRDDWGNVLGDLKRMALQKEEASQIAQYLREKREKLL